MNNKINAEQFVQMMISGANNLYNNRQTVDDLNVFPVPDGDTGTNMSMTINAMADALGEHISKSVAKAADTAGYATLRGARGNSGVILSQLFRGMSKGLKGVTECGATEFAYALKEGVDTAYRAVMNPTEGTILTVSREAAAGAAAAAEKGADFVGMLEGAVSRGQKALEMTTQMLPALKQAGVVDAGGKGWMLVLEGALEYIKTGTPVSAQRSAQSSKKTGAGTAQAAAAGNIKYMYCTEFIVQKKNPGVNVAAFREAIKGKGDCMLVIDDDEIVKVHIHTNHPGFVLERAVVMGGMINIKIDNMKYQHSSIINSEPQKTQEPEQPEEQIQEQPEVFDDGAAFRVSPEETQAAFEEKPFVPEKDVAVAAVCAGEGFEKILRDLGVDAVITGGQTMNPSTEDILTAAESLNAKTVYVFPNNKNIILAANQAKELSRSEIVVIPTRNVTECISAMLEFDAEKTPEENEKRMSRAYANVKTGQVTYAVRDTVIDGINISKGDVLGINGSKISVAGKDADSVCMRLASVMAHEDDEFITVYYGSEIDERKAEALGKKLEERYPDFEISVKCGGQPVYSYIISVE